VYKVLVGRGLVVAIVATSFAPRAFADDEPVLGEGLAVDAEVSAAASITTINTAAALTETASAGYFFASGRRQALAAEVFEAVSLIGDGSTPTFGFVGAAVRAVDRRRSYGFASMEFLRLGAGLAFASDGHMLSTGLGATASFGLTNSEGSGFSVHLDAYAFDLNAITGPDKVIIVGLGYVFSPISGTRAAPTRESAIPQTLHGACPYEDRYVDALNLAEHRAKEACTVQGSECEPAKLRAVMLAGRLAACRDGHDVGPPPK
jgi:hypothetical protein